MCNIIMVAAKHNAFCIDENDENFIQSKIEEGYTIIAVGFDDPLQFKGGSWNLNGKLIFLENLNDLNKIL